MTNTAATIRYCADCGVSENEDMICLGGAQPGVAARLLCGECDGQAERDWVDEDPSNRRHSLDTFSPVEW